jgi:hypothetical protein
MLRGELVGYLVGIVMWDGRKLEGRLDAELLGNAKMMSRSVKVIGYVYIMTDKNGQRV